MIKDFFSERYLKIMLYNCIVVFYFVAQIQIKIDPESTTRKQTSFFPLSNYQYYCVPFVPLHFHSVACVIFLKRHRLGNSCSPGDITNTLWPFYIKSSRRLPSGYVGKTLTGSDGAVKALCPLVTHRPYTRQKARINIYYRGIKISQHKGWLASFPLTPTSVDLSI